MTNSNEKKRNPIPKTVTSVVPAVTRDTPVYRAEEGRAVCMCLLAQLWCGLRAQHYQGSVLLRLDPSDKNCIRMVNKEYKRDLPRSQ